MVKQYFLLSALLVIPAAIVGWFLWMLGKSIWGLWQDRRLYQELDELAADAVERRRKREEARQARLANGCDHNFEAQVGGFPPNVCCKCGLEREKPLGPCDHVWRAVEGAVPNSACEKCGRKYRLTGMQVAN